MNVLLKLKFDFHYVVEVTFNYLFPNKGKETVTVKLNAICDFLTSTVNQFSHQLLSQPIHNHIHHVYNKKKLDQTILLRLS